MICGCDLNLSPPTWMCSWLATDAAVSSSVTELSGRTWRCDCYIRKSQSCQTFVIQIVEMCRTHDRCSRLKCKHQASTVKISSFCKSARDFSMLCDREWPTLQEAAPAQALVELRRATDWISTCQFMGHDGRHDLLRVLYGQAFRSSWMRGKCTFRFSIQLERACGSVWNCMLSAAGVSVHPWCGSDRCKLESTSHWFSFCQHLPGIHKCVHVCDLFVSMWHSTYIHVYMYMCLHFDFTYIYTFAYTRRIGRLYFRRYFEDTSYLR